MYSLTFSLAIFSALVKTVVDSSIDIYEKISSEMLPTPAKSHYTFNLRDLSKVFQGILSLNVKNCPDVRTFLRLWCHENQRVFQDRLIDTQDKDTFQRWLHEMLKRKFMVDWDYGDTFVKTPILFGDYLRMGVTGDDRVYEAVADPLKLSKLMENYLEEYNMSTPKTMNLVFFIDAIEHVSRLARILRSPRGNAMLVGLGGSGKQSLTKLSAFMSDYKCISIELKRGYNNNDFREDIKKLFMVAGVERQPVVFLFTDSQVCMCMCVFVCMCSCACVCACVWEREREAACACKHIYSTYIVCRYISTHIYIYIYKHGYVFIYICICVFIYVYIINRYIYIYIYICIDICICIYVCLCLCVCIIVRKRERGGGGEGERGRNYICISTYKYTYVNIYIYIYTYIHTHIHVYTYT